MNNTKTITISSGITDAFQKLADLSELDGVYKDVEIENMGNETLKVASMSTNDVPTDAKAITLAAGGLKKFSRIYGKQFYIKTLNAAGTNTFEFKGEALWKGDDEEL